MYIVFLGAPGAGKGTQAGVVAEKLKVPHIATGDLFRQALKEGTRLGLEAKKYMEKGLLVPDQVTIDMVRERIAAPDAKQGFILDGFPRNLEQAKALDTALKAQGKQLDRVIYIKVAEDELLKRLSGRWICGQCQAPYHETDSPPRTKGECDKCGGKLYQRADDTYETVKKRLQVYFTETAPLIDYYTGAGKLAEVNGVGTIDQVSGDILKALGKSIAGAR